MHVQQNKTDENANPLLLPEIDILQDFKLDPDHEKPRYAKRAQAHLVSLPPSPKPAGDI